MAGPECTSAQAALGQERCDLLAKVVRAAVEHYVGTVGPKTATKVALYLGYIPQCFPDRIAQRAPAGQTASVDCPKRGLKLDWIRDDHSGVAIDMSNRASGVPVVQDARQVRFYSLSRLPLRGCDRDAGVAV